MEMGSGPGTCSQAHARGHSSTHGMVHTPPSEYSTHQLLAHSASSTQGQPKPPSSWHHNHGSTGTSPHSSNVSAVSVGALESCLMIIS